MASKKAHNLIRNYRRYIQQITGTDPIEQVFSPENFDPDTRYVWAGDHIPHITIGQRETIDQLHLMWAELQTANPERTQL